MLPQSMSGAYYSCHDLFVKLSLNLWRSFFTLVTIEHSLIKDAKVTRHIILKNWYKQKIIWLNSILKLSQMNWERNAFLNFEIENWTRWTALPYKFVTKSFSTLEIIRKWWPLYICLKNMCLAFRLWNKYFRICSVACCWLYFDYLNWAGSVWFKPKFCFT